MFSFLTIDDHEDFMTLESKVKVTYTLNLSNGLVTGTSLALFDGGSCCMFIILAQ